MKISKHKAMDVALGMGPEQLRAIIERDGRPPEQPSRLNPQIPVGKVRELFLALAEKGVGPALRYDLRRDRHVPDLNALAYANAVREFGAP